MEQLHAHEVLHMMEGNSYSESSLKEAIIQKFGEHQHFYTCSAEDMDVDKLIEFLKAKGKFMPADDGLLICKKDEEHTIRKYVNDAQIKLGEEYI